MTIVRRLAKDLKKHARINRSVAGRTTERVIARHAKSDGTTGFDFRAALAAGRARRVFQLDVAAIRAKTGLSQDQFAQAFRISPHTLRNWEQGRRAPVGPAQALLAAIDRDPKGLLRALGV